MRGVSMGVVLAALAASVVANGDVVGEDVKRRIRDAEPEPDDQPDPRYVGIDYGAQPGFSVSADDVARIEAAQAKRDRKNARRLTLSASAPAPQTQRGEG